MPSSPVDVGRSLSRILNNHHSEMCENASWLLAVRLMLGSVFTASVDTVACSGHLVIRHMYRGIVTRSVLVRPVNCRTPIHMLVTFQSTSGRLSSALLIANPILVASAAAAFNPVHNDRINVFYSAHINRTG